MLWVRRSLLEELRPEKLTAASDAIPSRYEVGTQNHEGIAGVLGAAEYFAELGSRPGESTGASAAAFRANINRGKQWMRRHEENLAARLIDGLGQMRGVRIHGPSGANEMTERVSTISCSVDGRSPRTLAEALGSHNIFVWGGHNYALELDVALGLADAGGGFASAGAQQYGSRGRPGLGGPGKGDQRSGVSLRRSPRRGAAGAGGTG